MSHQWDRGVLAKSSWHKLEEIGAMANAAEMISAGERSGAWPTKVRSEALFTQGGLKAFEHGIVASYEQRSERVLGVVGKRFRATTPEEWRSLVNAAADAGAQPTGAFSLKGGSRVLATFQVGTANGLRTNLLMVDAFDGSLKLSSGFTTIDVVCANTLAMAFAADKGGMAQIRHTASAKEKIEALRGAIAHAVKGGQRVRDLYDAAKRTRVSRDVAMKAFDMLWPEAPEGATQTAKTRAENARQDARDAMVAPINRRDNAPGTVATLWNAATYLVDRTSDGKTRDVRGDGDMLDSLLFGERAKRVNEIMTVVEVLMKDGSTVHMSAPQAMAEGVDKSYVGKKVLADMLGEDN